MNVNAYIAGVSLGSPGPGAWGVVLVGGDHRKEQSGSEWMTTGNRMVLTAALFGLLALKRPCHIEVHSDAQYLIRGMNAWVGAWKRRGWKTEDGSPVKNEDLWREIDAVQRRHQVMWVWTAHHNQNTEADRAETLAALALESMTGLPAPDKTRAKRQNAQPAQMALLA